MDALLGLLRPVDAAELPKGLSLDTLTLVSGCLQQQTDPRSASEVAQLAGTSRVTARRYLEHLVDVRLAKRETRYGGSGRPEVEYRWHGSAGIA